MTRVLFVCMGNICRSPLAAAALRARLGGETAWAIDVDSAGTHAYHVGEPADPRAFQAGARRGYDLAVHRARQVGREDFARFDYVLAMDRANLGELRGLAPAGHGARLALLLEYAPQTGVTEVPDPYFGGMHGFEQALDLIDAAVDGLIARLRAR